jgi:beta-ureidopropionase / N-carbamoyl-L-amino-acid hydrolase
MTGRESHTGSTPMPMRRNALLGAARAVERIEAMAFEHAPHGMGAVGLMEVRPNSRNVIPGEVFFAVDFRHPENGVLDVMEQKLEAALAEIVEATGLELDYRKLWDSPPVKFDADCIAAVRKGAEQGGYSSRDIISGPGHDAAYIARVAPTTMIFVPCAGGLSHNEAESTSFEDCAAGAQVVLNAVLEYDERFARG